MPITPRDDREGVKTRSKATEEAASTPSTSTAGVSGSTPSPEIDLKAIMIILQDQARRQEEQARRQEEQLRQLQQEQARRQEEQAHHHEEQSRRQEAQARRQEEQLRQLQEEQARRQEELVAFLKESKMEWQKEIHSVQEKLHSHDEKLESYDEKLENHEERLQSVVHDIKKLETKMVNVTSGSVTITSAQAAGRFKVPPFDGTSSWTAYKLQFESVAKANGWDNEQAKTALTLGLRDQALSVLEALRGEVTYDRLLEALESRYGDSHLEHVYRAQLKDRNQRLNESLQQWALEIEKLVRKAYQRASASFLDSILVQAFIDGIRDVEVRAAVRLGHHATLKDAVAHALEVEAVRHDSRPHSVWQISTNEQQVYRAGFRPRCYHCTEKDHIPPRCLKLIRQRSGQEPAARSVEYRTGKTHEQAVHRRQFTPKCYECKERGHIRSSCPNRTRKGNDHREGEQRSQVGWRRTTHRNSGAFLGRPRSVECSQSVKPEETKDKLAVRIIKTDTCSNEWSNEAMQQAQQEDRDIKPILDWIKAGTPKPKWSEISEMSAATKSYWAQWESLMMHNGVLCRKWETANGKDSHLQLVVPKTKIREVLRSFHDGTSGGHLGVKKTLMKIRQRFYWIHCREDVEDWCRKCTSCASVKGPHTRSRGTLKVYNVGAPWERIALDVAGPFPASESGNKYILVVMDYFTKWPEAFAIPNQEAITVAEKLVTEVFCRYGVPLEIHSDQGRNFESQVFQETCKIMGIHKTRTTPYHPQSDGMVERFNQTLERHLAKVVENHQKDWDNHIPLFLLSYRTAVHENTTVTPACANFGRELRLPADLQTGRPPDSPQEITEYASALRERLNDVHTHVRESGLQASERMKTRYDRNSNQAGFMEGSLVWLHNPMRRKGKSPKLSPSWEGPYKVITRINDVTYRIQRSQRSPLKVVHVDRLAKYQGSNDARDEHV